MARFLRKKQTSTLSLNDQDYQFLADLLEHGYPLLDALQLLQKDGDAIKLAIESGICVEDLLVEQAEHRFAQHLAFFLQVSSVANAIQSSLHMKAFEQGIKQKLLKQCSYPIFLFVFAFVILCLFTQSIIPQMLQSFSLEQEFGGLLLCMNILQSITIIFFIVLLIGVVCVFLKGLRKRRQVFLFQYGTRISVVNDWVSYQLSGYLYELTQKGISTKHAMQYLLQLQEDSICCLVVKHIVHLLESGHDLVEIVQSSRYVNASFRLMFQMGAYNDTMCEMLTLFMKQQEVRWEKTIRKLGLVVQCIAYVFIASMVMVVYQIMLVPLSMLQTM